MGLRILIEMLLFRYNKTANTELKYELEKLLIDYIEQLNYEIEYWKQQNNRR